MQSLQLSGGGATGQLDRCLKKLLLADTRRRPEAQKALDLAPAQQGLLARLEALTVQTPAESVATLAQLTDQ